MDCGALWCTAVDDETVEHLGVTAMATSGQAVVIDLNEFRQRRQAQRAMSQFTMSQAVPMMQPPAGYSLVWMMLPVWYWVAG